MSYEPTNWQTGDIVTAEKLNKLENGVASGILVVNMVLDEDMDVPMLDKTYAEIESALENNKQVVIFNKSIIAGLFAYSVMNASRRQVGNIVVALSMAQDGVALLTFIAEEEDEYPIIYTGGDDPI